MGDDLKNKSILIIFEGGFIDSEKIHQENIKNRVNASIVFYLNPIVFLKKNFKDFLKSGRLDGPNPILNLLLSILTLALVVIFWVAAIFLLFFLRVTLSWKSYISFFKCLTLNNVLVGDGILSSVLRSRYSRAMLEDSFRFHLILSLYISFFFAICLYIVLLNWICILIGVDKYHWITDCVYINNSFRRFLSHKNSTEVRYMRGNYNFFQNFITNRSLQLEHFYVDHEKKASYSIESYSKAKDLINRIIDKKDDVGFLTSEAFNQLNKLNFNKGLVAAQRKSVVLFMHSYADAQYDFGVDEFLDINEWQNETIDICLQCGLDIFIRPHPEMLVKSHLNYPSELKYLDKLSHDYLINLSDLNNNAIIKTNKERVFFISPFLNLREMQKIFGMYLCATHHGSVAVESAFLGNDVIASVASPYDKKVDIFIDFYSTKERYKELIINWGQKSMKIDNEKVTAVLSFILRNNLRYKKI
jgi:hypothetical protein